MSLLNYFQRPKYLLDSRRMCCFSRVFILLS